MPPGATLAAMPEGAILNYLLRAPSTTRHSLLSPWEMAAAGGEERVLVELASHPPDFLVVLQMPMQEHGHGYFGDPEYGAQIMGWANANYDSEDVVRGPNRAGELELQALLFRRRAGRPPRDPASTPPN
jgi:hypothetical protein